MRPIKPYAEMIEQERQERVNEAIRAGHRASCVLFGLATIARLIELGVERWWPR